MHIQEYLENDTCCNLSSFIIYFSVQLLNETQDGASCICMKQDCVLSVNI